MQHPRQTVVGIPLLEHALVEEILSEAGMRSLNCFPNVDAHLMTA